jgi:CHAD domain-containing protein
MYEFVPKDYFEKFDKIITRSNERLSKYQTDPNEENVHNVRTAIRRLDAAYKILPKKIKQRQEILRFIRLRKEFFKINSEIRDWDIIKQNLSPYSSENIQKIIDKIDAKKQEKIILAQKKAKMASKQKTIQIDRDEISSEKLEKKFKKTTLQLINKIERSIPIIVNSDKKIEELHELRKDCKKLRYLLELTNHEESSSFISKLKEMQDVLGTIRDSDITLDFLKKYNLTDKIKAESEKREQLYKKFVQMPKF